MSARNDTEQRIVVIVHRLLPYHVARLRAAQRRTAGILVLEMSGDDVTYTFGGSDDPVPFERIVAFPEADVWRVNPFRVWRRVSELLAQFGPTHIFVYGWFETFSLATLLWANRHAIPCIVIATSTAADFARSNAGEYLKKRLLSRFTAAFVAGTKSREYLVLLGFPMDRIVIGHNVVDNDQFGVRDPRTADVPARFVFVGRYVEKKNIAGLLDAYKKYLAGSSRPWELHIHGSGPLDLEIRNRANEIAPTMITVSGPISYQALPRTLRLAGALVLPSLSEQWGLVVNEAMASGTPAIVSTRCGCAADLIDDRVNGWLCDPNDTEAMAKALACASSMPGSEWQRVSRSAQRTVEGWSLERFAEGFSRSLQIASHSAAKRASLFLPLLVLAISVYRNFAGSAPTRSV